tara:strand:- start:132 stop:284 length:153 start_codon:yes stop_codon:yes gene_type:complete
LAEKRRCKRKRLWAEKALTKKEGLERKEALLVQGLPGLRLTPSEGIYNGA